MHDNGWQMQSFSVVGGFLNKHLLRDESDFELAQGFKDKAFI